MIAITVRRKPKSVTANHRTGMNDHPITDERALLYGDIGVDDHIIADGNFIPDNNSRMQPNPFSNCDVIPDDCQRADRNMLTMPEIPADLSPGGESLPGAGPVGKKIAAPSQKPPWEDLPESDYAPGPSCFAAQ